MLNDGLEAWFPREGYSYHYDHLRTGRRVASAIFTSFGGRLPFARLPNECTPAATMTNGRYTMDDEWRGVMRCRKNLTRCIIAGGGGVGQVGGGGWGAQRRGQLAASISLSDSIQAGVTTLSLLEMIPSGLAGMPSRTTRAPPPARCTTVRPILCCRRFSGN